MTRGMLSLAAGIVAASFAAGGVAAAQTGGSGTIRGHVRLLGKPPGNPVIHMTWEPMCASISAGKRVVQETVLAALDGSLANVFVQLDGSFPETPVPTQPVTIDQRGCIYTPRIVGVRLGQILQVRNSDNTLHNVHGLSARGNGFNVGQPLIGMVNQFRLKEEETMMKLACDAHTWMRAYIGVVKHPYFAVTGSGGTFEIANVPAGSQTLHAWHEQYGRLQKTVLVKPAGATTVDFSFPIEPATSGRRGGGSGTSARDGRMEILAGRGILPRAGIPLGGKSSQ